MKKILLSLFQRKQINRHLLPDTNTHFSCTELLNFINSVKSLEELINIEMITNLMRFDGDLEEEETFLIYSEIVQKFSLMVWLDDNMPLNFYPLIGLSNHINCAKCIRELDAIKLHLQLNQDNYKKNGIWIHSYYIRGLFEVKTYQLETNHFDHDTTIR